MERSIGVIDSGVGGLTVAYELMRQLPKENIIYLGDTLRCPYGPRSQKEVRQFTWEMVHFMLEKNIKMLILACNTATAFTLTEIQHTLKIPVLGVIQPGARAAINKTKNSHVGVIATEGTIRSNAYPQALKNINEKIEVYSLACPLFVPMVEQGIVEGAEATDIVKEELRSLKEHHRMDTLILGCTHYPIIENIIRSVMKPHVSIISSGEETAREASAILEFHHLLNNGEKPSEHQFYTTGDLNQFKKLYGRIFKGKMEHVQAAIMKQACLGSL
ncbi:glutamate racemase [Virgibacillus sp. W0181]|uniref:glutamate racemase n=1 Tax=Virgibacillus sp. W0181 TaxID=3391581 RepID=UPI003F4701BF